MIMKIKENTLMPPERLLHLISTLPTGTLLLIHKPFVWYELKSYGCAFMRWVLRSDLYHHIDIVRHDCGRPFVVGAIIGESTRQRKLGNYIDERKGYLVTIKKQAVDPALIVMELDKKYDTPAALSLVWLRISGRWNGRTGKFAEKKSYCLELAARICGFEKPYMATMNLFE
jgi:hypothetical protein